jgi:hypothetical protein
VGLRFRDAILSLVNRMLKIRDSNERTRQNYFCVMREFQIEETLSASSLPMVLWWFIISSIGWLCIATVGMIAIYRPIATILCVSLPLRHFALERWVSF